MRSRALSRWLDRGAFYEPESWTEICTSFGAEHPTDTAVASTAFAFANDLKKSLMPRDSEKEAWMDATPAVVMVAWREGTGERRKGEVPKEILTLNVSRKSDSTSCVVE